MPKTGCWSLIYILINFTMQLMRERMFQMGSTAFVRNILTPKNQTTKVWSHRRTGIGKFRRQQQRLLQLINLAFITQPERKGNQRWDDSGEVLRGSFALIIIMNHKIILHPRNSDDTGQSRRRSLNVLANQQNNLTTSQVKTNEIRAKALQRAKLLWRWTKSNVMSRTLHRSGSV